MQLQKLVYIAHGWNLAVNDAPLTEDTPHAWDYGPVYKYLWEALRYYGKDPVPREICAGEFGDGEFLDDPESEEVVSAQLTQKERAVIDRVYSGYGKFHAYKLSALTHQPGTPWDQVYNHGSGRMAPIDDDRVRKYFIELAQSRQSAA